MPYTIVEFQPTPNPNALKCILDRPLVASTAPGAAAEPIRSFRSPEQAASDPLGRALLSVPGVSLVLISAEWLTVNKTPAAPWSAVKKEVLRVLAGS